MVGPAPRPIHDDPARPWTVAGLAAKAGCPRAAFAQRFSALVGEPPMAYPAGRRIALAADLLRTSDLTLETIAHRAGYASAFALSTAFKRRRRPLRLRARPRRLTPGGRGLLRRSAGRAGEPRAGSRPRAALPRTLPGCPGRAQAGGPVRSGGLRSEPRSGGARGSPCGYGRAGVAGGPVVQARITLFTPNV
ncbi:helix-turn-helix transcriptional regulator [Nocardiopsis composta]|uniref:helix-turn-helix transcriptional regulator n=1 Tax=Nocardiopsis composta TaxID=157465 RepID=UPI0028A58449|nr:helix-turn-helix transcriptional regulator [Nocardiopsis composta]